MNKCAIETPLLTLMVEAAKKSESLDLRKVAFICVQHLFFTTVNLIQSLIHLGADPAKIYFTGKFYSASTQVFSNLLDMGIKCQLTTPPSLLGVFTENSKKEIQLMWQYFLNENSYNDINTIVILDDGGNCLTTVPNEISEQFSVIGVEQTTSGITNPRVRILPFPVIEVATSAAKQYIESPLIADAVVNKLNDILPLNNKNLICGVIGLGVIGQAVVSKLSALGYRVMSYDKAKERNDNVDSSEKVENMEDLIKFSDYIFGCSGEDITKDIDIEYLAMSNKVLISCSSQDKEFLSLLKKIQAAHDKPIDALSNIEYKTSSDKIIKILRGGFPINLDNSGESVPAADIQMTRGLLLGGLLQAIAYLPINESNKNVRYMLDPEIQKYVVTKWLNLTNNKNRYEEKLLQNFTNVEWIRTNSKGDYKGSDYIFRCFSSQYNKLINNYALEPDTLNKVIE